MQPSAKNLSAFFPLYILTLNLVFLLHFAVLCNPGGKQLFRVALTLCEIQSVNVLAAHHHSAEQNSFVAGHFFHIHSPP